MFYICLFVPLKALRYHSSIHCIIRIFALLFLAINEDRSDTQRLTNRLSLLVGSLVTEAVEITSRYKVRARDILQGASSLKPGDYTGMSLFLQNLPIDSLLERPNLTSSYGAVSKPPSGRPKSAAVISRSQSSVKGGNNSRLSSSGGVEDGIGLHETPRFSSSARGESPNSRRAWRPPSSEGFAQA